MSYALATSAAISLIYTGVSAAASGGRNTTSTSRLEFPEETRRLFQGLEEPLLQGSFAEQASILSPLLAGFRGRDASQQRFGAPTGLIESAARRGASQAGVTDFGPISEDIQGLSPQLMAALQQLAVARGTQINSVVPVGFGQFLSPQTFTQQRTEGPSAFETGLQFASTFASAYGAATR